MNMQIALMCWQWLINKRLPRFIDPEVQGFMVLLIGLFKAAGWGVRTCTGLSGSVTDFH